MAATTDTTEKSTQRITALLPPSLHSQVTTDATYRMTSVSAVVREILARHYRNGAKENPTA